MKKKFLFLLIVFSILSTSQNTYSMNTNSPPESTTLADLVQKDKQTADNSIEKINEAFNPQLKKSDPIDIPVSNSSEQKEKRSIESILTEIRETRIPKSTSFCHYNGWERIQYDDGGSEEVEETSDKLKWAKHIIENPHEHPKVKEKMEKKALSTSQRLFAISPPQQNISTSPYDISKTGFSPNGLNISALETDTFSFSGGQLTIMNELRNAGGFPTLTQEKVKDPLKISTLSPTYTGWVSSLTMESPSKQFETIMTNGSFHELCSHGSQKKGALNVCMKDLNGKTSPIKYWSRMLTVLYYAKEQGIPVGKDVIHATRRNITAQSKIMLELFHMIENGEQTN